MPVINYLNDLNISFLICSHFDVGWIKLEAACSGQLTPLKPQLGMILILTIMGTVPVSFLNGSNFFLSFMTVTLKLDSNSSSTLNINN